MRTYKRQQEILEYLEECQYATVSELAGKVFASEASVRRDIAALESKGYVSKIYGGVVLAEYKNSVIPVELRDRDHPSVKDEIAKRAVEFVFDGATIFMDGSSTVRRMLPFLDEYRELTIITNNLRIFKECKNPRIRLYCTGGCYDRKSSIFTGTAAEQFLDGVTADLLFFSSPGISEAGTISDVSEAETTLPQILLRRARKKFFLCDASKIGVQKMFTVCGKEDIDDIVCDVPLPWEK